MPQKLYCYVDESGQHTFGRLFVVSVVLVGPKRDDLLQACEAIEERTGKGRRKWIKTPYDRRAAYIQQLLDTPLFCGKLYYAHFENTRDYTGATAWAIVGAIRAAEPGDYKATVIIDGLIRDQEPIAAVALRRLGVRLRKLRGARDESDALVRLADAVCGLVVAAGEGQEVMLELFNRAVETQFLQDISDK
jgi:hypothetical protein